MLQPLYRTPAVGVVQRSRHEAIIPATAVRRYGNSTRRPDRKIKNFGALVGVGLCEQISFSRQSSEGDSPPDNAAVQ